MEQRTFFAIIVSFIFLMAYNALVISPQQKSKLIDSAYTATQANSGSVRADVHFIANQTRESDDRKESDRTIDLGNFKIVFGENSGIIKNIYAKSFTYSSILTNYLSLYPDQVLKSYTTADNEINFLYEHGGFHWKQSLKTIDSNRLMARITIISSAESQDGVINFGLFNIDAKPIIGNVELMRDSMLFELSHMVSGKVLRRGHAYKFANKDNQKELKEIDWFAWRDRYHVTIVKPQFKCAQFSTSVINENNLNISVNDCGLELSKPYEFEIYIGPQDFQLLRSFGGNIYNVMAFSGNPVLNFIEKAIYRFLLFLNGFTHNWGISIILISLIIYGIAYPLTFKSMMSMRKMQELQPKMSELREKFKEDPQKLNAEVIQLYKVNNVNPLSGCLPTLLQMPVFISLYQVLWRTHNFQHANFLWIKDLSMPDRAFLLNMNFPFIGSEINILPILMSVVMFFQQRFTSKNVVIADPAQAMQQKMMMWIFPIFIGGIFYHFASGLTLYFTIFYLMSTLMQYKMSKLRNTNHE